MRLEALQAGMLVPYGGDRLAVVSRELAEAFESGDRLVVVQENGDLLHIPASTWEAAKRSVDAAVTAFGELASTPPAAITTFYRGFAARLADGEVADPIFAANAADVDKARAAGRSTTRLELTPRMRDDMVEGLRSWADLEGGGDLVEKITRPGWTIELRKAGLGVVGFVFEGRPNVFADATGVLRFGNTVVFRIGSDALGTTRAVVEHALEPALDEAGLPPGAVSLIDDPSRAAGWAMFSDRRLALAVARGSGSAVAQLGAVARQAGLPVSLHGTGGAWLVVTPSAAGGTISRVVANSLDRKVCNTLNTVAVVGEEADRLIPFVLDGLREAADRRGSNPKLHVVGDLAVPDEWLQNVEISRPGGPVEEPMTESLPTERLGEEWEWEDSPEITLFSVDSVAAGVEAFNRHSPRFVASLLSEDEAEHEWFYAAVDAPFVGNGFTRWVDGQYAFNRPELGLSNWQSGRLLARGAVLSGDSIFTVRARAIVDDPDLSR